MVKTPRRPVGKVRHGRSSLGGPEWPPSDEARRGCRQQPAETCRLEPPGGPRASSARRGARGRGVARRSPPRWRSGCATRNGLPPRREAARPWCAPARAVARRPRAQTRIGAATSGRPSRTTKGRRPGRVVKTSTRPTATATMSTTAPRAVGRTVARDEPTVRGGAADDGRAVTRQVARRPPRQPPVRQPAPAGTASGNGTWWTMSAMTSSMPVPARSLPGLRMRRCPSEGPMAR